MTDKLLGPEKALERERNGQLTLAARQQVWDELFGWLAKGLSVRSACGLAGMSEQNHAWWMARGGAPNYTGSKFYLPPEEASEEAREYVARYDKALAEAEKVGVESLMNAVPKDWRAAVVFLERRFGDVWGQRKDPAVEITQQGIERQQVTIYLPDNGRNDEVSPEITAEAHPPKTVPLIAPLPTVSPSPKPLTPPPVTPRVPRDEGSRSGPPALHGLIEIDDNGLVSYVTTLPPTGEERTIGLGNVHGIRDRDEQLRDLLPKGGPLTLQIGQRWFTLSWPPVTLA